MKKLALSLITCLAFTQSAYAFLPTITSNLGTSLRVYEAIIDAVSTSFSGVIPQNEFIVKIDKREKHETNLNTPHNENWIISTIFRSQRTFNENVNLELPSNDLESNFFHHHPKLHKYNVLVRITPNPEIGPPLIEVLSISRASSHSCDSHGFLTSVEAEASE